MRALNSIPLARQALLALSLFIALLASRAEESPAISAPPTALARRGYFQLMDPVEHPDYDRRAVKPPSWSTFKNRTQFTCLRGFSVENDLLAGYAEELEKYTRTYGLGDVIWPAYPVLFAKNLGDLADEIRRRDLYLFDIWGYVPGSGPGGYWQQFKPPSEALALLESKLGERWLGTDIGEQDGRYVGGYADQMTPASADRREQYLNFQRHFARMGEDLGHKHATLVSLNFGHYLLKEGTFTLIGAETAQALPNCQVYYAFIRGAGKQYGAPWFGNASVYNRWGYKSYDVPAGSEAADHGPAKGSSLSLLKRLLYNHIAYNSVAVGFESGWFQGGDLSPIGRIQQAAQRWVKENGQPGVMHTPVALLLDFHSGWTFPRHLYSDNLYRVWGNLPYEPGDFLTDAVLDLLYPGYQNSSYYHDESGFLAPTPYGDIADCLLSDAPGWLLARYPVVVVAGRLAGGRELRDKLQAYMEHGGRLVVTSGNLARLPGGLGGRTTAASDLSIDCGKGKLTLFASEFGIDLKPVAPLRGQIDQPLPKPYSLRPEVRQALEEIFRGQALFQAGGADLSLVTCRKAPGEYLLCVANNSWRAQPLSIVSHCGVVASIRELPLDVSEKSAIGYLPPGVEAGGLGATGPDTIAGGEVRILQARVKEAGVEEIPRLAPPARPRGRALPLRHARSITEEVLARPTFFEHFDGVVVEGRYLRERETAALREEAGWIRRQGLRVFVDLSAGINLYPGLRLIDNVAADYAASLEAITNVIAKMEAIGSRDLVLSLHRYPENNFTDAQTQAAFEATLKALATHAAVRQVTLHLRLALGKPPWSLPEAARMLDRVGAANLRLAASTALLPASPENSELRAALTSKLGVWLLAAPRADLAGKTWDAHAPLHAASSAAAMARWLALSPQTPVLFDAVYADADDEYLDAAALKDALPVPIAH